MSAGAAIGRRVKRVEPYPTANSKRTRRRTDPGAAPPPGVEGVYSPTQSPQSGPSPTLASSPEDSAGHFPYSSVGAGTSPTAGGAVGGYYPYPYNYSHAPAAGTAGGGGGTSFETSSSVPGMGMSGPYGTFADSGSGGAGSSAYPYGSSGLTTTTSTGAAGTGSYPNPYGPWGSQSTATTAGGYMYGGSPTAATPRAHHGGAGGLPAVSTSPTHMTTAHHGHSHSHGHGSMAYGGLTGSGATATTHGGEVRRR
jgi:hypothetical protein